MFIHIKHLKIIFEFDTNATLNSWCKRWWNQ